METPIQWTLILGDNGVGKTTLLQCLAWMKPDLQMDDKVLSNEENSTLYSLIRVGTTTLGGYLQRAGTFKSTKE